MKSGVHCSAGWPSNVYGMAMAFVLLTVLQRRGVVGRAVANVLSSQMWPPVADLSYSAYLYHVQVD